jgi:hypothetical protein
MIVRLIVDRDPGDGLLATDVDDGLAFAVAALTERLAVHQGGRHAR